MRLALAFTPVLLMVVVTSTGARLARADDDPSLAKTVRCYKSIGRFTETDSTGAPFVAKAAKSQTMHLSKKLTASLVTNEFLVASPDRLDRPGVFWAREDGIYFYPLVDSRGVPQSGGQFYLNYPGGDGSKQVVVTIAQGRVLTQSKASHPSQNGIAGAMNTENFSREVVNNNLQKRLQLVNGVASSNTSLFVNGLNRRKSLPDDFVRTGLDQANREYQRALQDHPHAGNLAVLQNKHSDAVERVASQKLESDFNPDLKTFMGAIQGCEKVDAQNVHLLAQSIENTVQPYAGPLTAFSANGGTTSGSGAGAASGTGPRKGQPGKNTATVKTNSTP